MLARVFHSNLDLSSLRQRLEFVEWAATHTDINLEHSALVLRAPRVGIRVHFLHRRDEQLCPTESWTCDTAGWQINLCDDLSLGIHSPYFASTVVSNPEAAFLVLTVPIRNSLLDLEEGPAFRSRDFSGLGVVGVCGDGLRWRVGEVHSLVVKAP
jgi:hypothetical protein